MESNVRQLEFESDEYNAKFSVHSGRLGEEDCKLNSLVYDLIERYFTDLPLEKLKDHLERDKPVASKYR